MRRLAALLLFVLAAAIAAPAPVIAQSSPSFSPTGGVALSVSNSSSRVAFATAGPTALVINTGSNTVYLAFGGSGVTATTSGYYLGAGCSVAYDVNGQGFVAAITASSTSALSIYTGSGLPTLPPSACASSGGGGGGNVTIIAPLGSQPSANGVSVTIASDQAAVAVKNATAAALNDTATQGPAAAVTAGWPVINGEPADTTGTFTNGTQAGNVTSATVDGYETATLSINGTFSTATATFLASDDGGTTFFPIQCARSDGTAIELGYTTITNTNRAWYCPIHGFDSVRVLSSAVASGTVNVRISISSSPTAAGVTQSVIAATLPLPTGAATSANQPSNAAQGSATSGQTGTLAMCAALTATPTVTTALTNAFYCNVHGALYIVNTDAAGNVIDFTLVQAVYQQPQSASAAGITEITSAAVESNHVFKGSAGNGYRYAITTGASAGFLMLFNATTAPADGAVTPVICRAVAANTSLEVNHSGMPDVFSTGITGVFSTTGCFTKTASATAEFEGQVK